MQVDADGDPIIPRLINTERTARWSQTCSTCNHSRADHIVNNAANTNVFAVDSCNLKINKYVVDVATGEHVWAPEGNCPCDKFTTA